MYKYIYCFLTSDSKDFGGIVIMTKLPDGTLKAEYLLLYVIPVHPTGP